MNIDKNLTSEEAFIQACEGLGYQPGDVLPDVSKQPEWLQKKTTAGIKLDLIAKWMQKGEPLKIGQWRWFPVFTNPLDPSGVGFSFSNADDWRAHTSVGARREFATEDVADQFGTQFLDLHKDELCYTESEVENA